MRTHLTKKAAKILDGLVAGMKPGTSKKYDNGGGFMALSVERLTENSYSMAHYYEQNGDLCPDPDVEFRKMNHGWVPVNITQPFGGYSETVVFDDDGKIKGYYRRAHTDLRLFTQTWLDNIKSQQGL